MASKGRKIDVLIVIEEGARTRLAQLERALRSAGLSRIKHHKAIGTITGEADPEALGLLKAVPGVIDVEGGASYQLPPPESDLQ